MTCERCKVRRARWLVTITGGLDKLEWRRCTPCLSVINLGVVDPATERLTITRLGQSGE